MTGWLTTNDGAGLSASTPWRSSRKNGEICILNHVPEGMRSGWGGFETLGSWCCLQWRGRSLTEPRASRVVWARSLGQSELPDQAHDTGQTHCRPRRQAPLGMGQRISPEVIGGAILFLIKTTICNMAHGDIDRIQTTSADVERLGPEGDPDFMPHANS